MQFKQTIARAGLLSISIAIGILLCEAGSRLILNPADFLSPEVMRDHILGHTIKPKSSGFDEWGFRNKRVPQTADVVTVGDSHTYGNTATMDDSWPSVVARATGHEVYNLGLGGYGPNQYYHLLTSKGLKLHPKWVICGLYMGDDFENAFSITHGFGYWSSLRNGNYENVNPDIWDPGPPVWGADARNWLSSHSMTYRLIFHGPVMAILKEYIRFNEVSTGKDPYTSALILSDKNIREAFRPLGVAESLNQSSPLIQEGMRITFQLLKKMDWACQQDGCRLLVIIIPTKETVFSDYLESSPSLHLREAISKVIVNERSARKVLIEFLASEGIAHLDTLPALKQSIGNQLYAQTTRDMHPGKNGYKVIGEAVAEYLNRASSGG
jgi:hypothetical protein